MYIVNIPCMFCWTDKRNVYKSEKNESIYTLLFNEKRGYDVWHRLCDGATSNFVECKHCSHI